MEIIADKYYIFSSNSSKRSGQVGSVTVRDAAGNTVAKITTDRSQPLKFLRRWPASPERLSLVDGLLKAGVDAEIVNKIVSM